MANYQPWVTIDITHEYFLQTRKYIDLRPTQATQQLLIKLGVILKCIGNQRWVLLSSDGFPESLSQGPQQLQFAIMNVDPTFYYCTSSEIPKAKTKDYEWIPIGKNGIWQQLNIKLNTKILSQQQRIELSIPSAKKYVEFIVIPKNGSDETLQLKEGKDQLSFKASKIEFPDVQQLVYSFISTQAITLQEVYPYKITLWKLVAGSEVLLSSFIPFPKISSISMTKPLDTITSYFYF